MFNHFTKDARRAAHDAPAIARELGDSSVEAEHLLIAIARHEDAVARVLHDAGSTTTASRRRWWPRPIAASPRSASAPST